MRRTSCQQNSRPMLPPYSPLVIRCSLVCSCGTYCPDVTSSILDIPGYVSLAVPNLHWVVDQSWISMSNCWFSGSCQLGDINSDPYLSQICGAYPSSPVPFHVKSPSRTSS